MEAVRGSATLVSMSPTVKQRSNNKVWMRAVVDDGCSDYLEPWLVCLRNSEGAEVGQIVTVSGQRLGRHAKRIVRG